MNLRTKLLCTLVVPLAALLTVTVIAGRDRLDQADRAERTGDRIGVVAAALDLDHHVQRELAASANRTDKATLTDARSATDQSASSLTALLGTPTGSTPYDHAVGRVRTDLKALTATRTGVDGGSAVATFGVPYAELAASLSDLAATIGDEADDPSLARDTAAIATLSRVSDATAAEWAAIDAAASRGGVASGESGLIRGAVDSRQQWEGVYQGLATGSARDSLRALMIGDAINVSNSIEAAALRVTDGGTFTADVAKWRSAMSTRLDLLHKAEAASLTSLSTSATELVDDAQGDLRTFAAIAGGSILLAVGLGLLMVRAITRPLRRLTNAARRLADEQLPSLVEGLKSPGPDDQRFLKAAVEPIDVRSSDELGQLAKAFNAVQTVAVDVAAEQADLLRKGIGDLFVSLARRNQVLIDRQIEFLDELEAAEDDPDQLSSLYKLDHLATRMRRNAESLLVLAGMEPTRRRAKPVALIDVVRAAIGETEEYARVDLIAFEEVGVSGTGAVDLGHLLAELLENATHFSPPETKVTVEGRLARNGYVVSIVDKGIGMTAEQLSDANALLAAPPPVGLALGRSLGFTVVARLAARHGVSVRLMPAPGTGTSVVVHLPAHLIATSDAHAEVVARAVATTPSPTQPRSGSLGVFEHVADAAAPQAPAAPTFEGAPEPLPQRVPAPQPEPIEAELEPPFEHSEPAPEPVATGLIDEAEAVVEDEAADARRFTILDDDEFEQTFQRAWGAAAPDSAQEPDVDAAVEPAEARLEPVAADLLSAFATTVEPTDAAPTDDELPPVETIEDDAPEVETSGFEAGELDEDGDESQVQHAAAEADPIETADAEGEDDVVDEDEDEDEGAVPDVVAEEPVPAEPAGDAWGIDDEGWSDDAPEARPMAWIDDDAGELPKRVPQHETPAPVASLEDALPLGSAFDRGLADLMRGDDVLGPPALVEPPVAVPAAEPTVDTVPEPPEPIAAVDADPAPLTAAGLVRRVPKSGQPGAADVGDARPAIAANKRSPEDVRAMLAQYRSGLRRGRDDVEEPGDE